MRPTIAAARFVAEKKIYVVSVKSVIDFYPKTDNDFDPDKDYDVNWPILKRQDSATSATEEPFKARILLLAASKESLIRRAKILKVKLPRAFLESEQKPKTVPAPKEDAAKAASKRAKQQVEAAMKIATKKRLENLLNVHKGGAILNSASESPQKSPMKSPKVVTMDKTPVKTLDKTPLKTPDKTPIKTPDKSPAKSPLKSLKSPLRKSGSKLVVLPEVQAKKSPKSPSSRVHRSGTLVKRTGGETESDSESEVGSFLSTPSKKAKEMSERILTLQSKLQEAVRNSRRLTTELNSLNHRVNKWKDLFTKFYQETLDIFNEDKEPDNGGKKNSRVSDWVVQATEYTKGLKHSDRDLLSTAGPHGSNTKSVQSTVAASATTVKRKIDFDEDKEKKRLKTETEKDSKESKNKGRPVQELGPDDKKNDELAMPLYKALKKEATLEEKDGKVLLGNGIWIKKKVWEDKVVRSKKHSLLVKDLAAEIFGENKCASMSLRGGKSPKTQTSGKPAAPANAVEAIYAVYRAKLMMEGVMNNTILDSNIKENARNYLTQKFHESAKKKARAMKAAQTFASSFDN